MERGEAIKQIAKMGPKAEPAVPALLAALRDDDKYVYRVMRQFHIHRQASAALVKIGGPKVVNGLIKLLSDDDDKIILRAADTLGNMSKSARAAIPALEEVRQRNKNPEVRRHIRNALEQIEERQVAHMPPKKPKKPDNKIPVEDPLTSVQRDLYAPDAVLRESAARHLGTMGSKAHRAIGDLRNVLTDSDSLVRLEAAWALWQVAHQAKDTFPILVASLGDSSADVGNRAEQILKQIGPKDVWALDILMKHLESTEQAVRIHSVRAIGQMGPAANKAESVLIRTAVADPNADFRAEVYRTLEKIRK